jgi:S-methylmethionine-dependent homocysteine/selenocysteine methylase
VILLDGATGTELGRRGVDTRGRLFSAQALLDATGIEQLRQVHLEYVRAGAQVVTANTFRTNPRKAGAGWRELTELAVRTARAAGVAVAGSIAPAEDCYLPALRPPADAAFREHCELADALAHSGCDLLLVETVAAADEGLAAVRAAVRTGLPVWVAAMGMPEGCMRDGSDLRQFFGEAASLGAEAALLNCIPCEGVDLNLDVARESGIAFGAYAHMGDVDANAGWPATPVLTPEAYAERALRWVQRGATILGGCCGTTPAHITALARISR